MKIELVGIYQKSLLGGLGGLLGWALISVFVRVPTDSTFLLYIRDMLTGALIGLTIGACCGSWDGLFRDRNRRRLVHGMGVGGAIGLVGGMVGLVMGEIFFGIAGGGLFPRAIGWGLFGAAVGTNEGLAKKMPQKLTYGAYGGFLGGLVGGSTYETLANVFQWIGFGRDVAIGVGGAVGLVLLGLCIGCLMGLVEDLLRPAWLSFTSGKLEGQTRTLDPKKSVTTIGRAELADICLLGDPAIVDKHAELFYRDGGFVIKPIGGELRMKRNGPFQAVSDDCRLEPGDMIQIGSVRLKYSVGDATT